jgi:hypothetical protein
MRAISFLFIFSLLVSFKLSAQKIEKGYFRSPVDFPIGISGSFCELRNNHFHMGIDIKTQGVEGKNMYAVADGYVSRIKISSTGYGKALYITHPNGYVSVYAHLKSFSPKIEKYVKEAQYLNQKFEIELFPDSSILPVKKSEVIALSGNSGSSAAPHLHFEIREEKSEIPVSPLLWGFDIADNISPIFKDITIYPLGESGEVNFGKKPKRYPLVKQAGNYALAQPQTINVYGEIGFGIDAFDQMNGHGNHLGLHSIELKVDDKSIYQIEFDKLSFDDTRYINAHIDYPQYKEDKKMIHRCYALPGDKLTNYRMLENLGIYKFRSDTEHLVTININDVSGNSSSTQLKVKSHSLPAAKTTKDKIGVKASSMFRYDINNLFKNEWVQMELPIGVLYEDLAFEFSIGDTLKNNLSPLYQLHFDKVPLHKNIIIKLKAPAIDTSLQSKVMLLHYDDKGKSSAAGGTFQNGFIVSQVKRFGAYAITLDTVPPVITPINIPATGLISNLRELKFKIGDGLSGIGSYNAFVNGEWICMDFDAKSGLLSFDFHKALPKGKFDFVLIVEDTRGNSVKYQKNLIR